jgi:hypothetical protein
MNVTIFGPYADWSPHFETELELAELHLQKGDTVSFITCDAGLNACEPNHHHNYAVCVRCMGRARAGLKLLDERVRVIPLSSLILPIRSELNIVNSICEKALSYEALYDITVDNFDLGAAALSTMNSLFRDPSPNPLDNPSVTRAVISSALATYKALCKYLAENVCEMFYVLNGRLANLRAALRACQLRNISCLVHERGSDLHSYILAPNTMPHDPSFLLPYMSSIFERIPRKVKAKLAREFYSERSQGIIHNWHSFTQQQQSGLLPAHWERSSRRLAVFTSTESEFSSLRSFYPKGFYNSQKEGLIQIVEDLARRNYQGALVIRMHPNSHDTKSDFTNDLKQFSYPFLTVIPPLGKIDSYALLKTSNAVLTFGSTIGIEAAYWGVPSILGRWSPYQHLGSTYNPRNHEQLVDYLLRRLRPRPNAGAINYGYYAKVYGTQLRLVRAFGVNDCTFKEEKVIPEKTLRKIYYALTSETPGGSALVTALNGWEHDRQKSLYKEAYAGTKFKSG